STFVPAPPPSTRAPAPEPPRPTSTATPARPARAATWARTSSCREDDGAGSEQSTETDMHVLEVSVRNLLAAGVLSVLVVGATGAQAADRFVSTGGSDTANDCLSSGNPCRTVGYALTQAASGDTVKVAEGTYQENFRVDYPTSLTLSGGWSREFTGRDPT